MRSDQLGLKRRIIRAIEASPSGLAVAEIAKREETGVRTTYSDLEAFQIVRVPPVHRESRLGQPLDLHRHFKTPNPPRLSNKNGES